MSLHTIFTAQTNHLLSEGEASDVIAADLLTEALETEFPAYTVVHADCDSLPGHVIICLTSALPEAPAPTHLHGWGTTGEYGLTLYLVIA